MKKTSFNDHWTCEKQGDSAEPKAVTLPHDAMLFEKRDRKAATAGACGYFPGGSILNLIQRRCIRSCSTTITALACSRC